MSNFYASIKNKFNKKEPEGKKIHQTEEQRQNSTEFFSETRQARGKWNDIS
jgi:hypothetical protein